MVLVKPSIIAKREIVRKQVQFKAWIGPLFDGTVGGVVGENTGFVQFVRSQHLVTVLLLRFCTPFIVQVVDDQGWMAAVTLYHAKKLFVAGGEIKVRLHLSQRVSGAKAVSRILVTAGFFKIKHPQFISEIQHILLPDGAVKVEHV